MTPAAFTTRRLDVQSWAGVCADPDRYAQLHTDLTGMLTPPVLRHLPPSVQLPNTADPVADWILQRQAETSVSLVRDGSNLVGLLFLFTRPGTADTHVGYLLDQAAWGKGYASELVAGLMTYLSDKPHQRLLGGVAIDNPASARVLQKSGFVLDPARSQDDINIFTREIGTLP